MYLLHVDKVTPEIVASLEDGDSSMLHKIEMLLLVFWLTALQRDFGILHTPFFLPLVSIWIDLLVLLIVNELFFSFSHFLYLSDFVSTLCDYFSLFGYHCRYVLFYLSWFAVSCMPGRRVHASSISLAGESICFLTPYFFFY